TECGRVCATRKEARPRPARQSARGTSPERNGDRVRRVAVVHPRPADRSCTRLPVTPAAQRTAWRAVWIRPVRAPGRGDRRGNRTGGAAAASDFAAEGDVPGDGIPAGRFGRATARTPAGRVCNAGRTGAAGG